MNFFGPTLLLRILALEKFKVYKPTVYADIFFVLDTFSLKWQ